MDPVTKISDCYTIREQLINLYCCSGAFSVGPCVLFVRLPAKQFQPTAGVVRVFHGWQDDIVPPENAWRFCQSHD
jgi:hypothetical protein